MFFQPLLREVRVQTIILMLILPVGEATVKLELQKLDIRTAQIISTCITLLRIFPYMKHVIRELELGQTTILTISCSYESLKNPFVPLQIHGLIRMLDSNGLIDPDLFHAVNEVLRKNEEAREEAPTIH